MSNYRFISKELIQKGWSGDKKYCAIDKCGNKFLLRVSPIEQYERKKNEFELMQEVAALGIPMCKPLEFGISDEGVYSVQTWIDGIDAEENIHSFTKEELYAYGFILYPIGNSKCFKHRIRKCIYSDCFYRKYQFLL